MLKDKLRFFVEGASPEFWADLFALIAIFVGGIYASVELGWRLGLYLVVAAVGSPIIAYIIVRKVNGKDAE